MDALPTVRFELRIGSARPTLHDMTDAGFLIGGVPGCDLRLPGAAQPPVFCLVARRPDGVFLRKLAPTQPLLVNGRSVSLLALSHGDRITLGAVDLLVQLTPAAEASPPLTTQHSPIITDELERRRRELDEQAQELETDRIIWYRRREEIEQECRQREESLQALKQTLEREQQELTVARQALAERAPAVSQVPPIPVPAAQDRQELAVVRQRLYDQYRQRRDRLTGLQQAIATAARKIQEHKRQADAEASRLAQLRREVEARQAELDRQAAEFQQTRQALDTERAEMAGHQQVRERQLADGFAQLQTAEQQLAVQRQTLDKTQAQYQADLVRMDRQSAQLEQKQQQIEERGRQIEVRYEALHQDLHELEEQAGRVDEAHTRLADEAEQMARQREELEQRRREVDGRAAELEGQQAMLATLRGRHERMREEMRRESQLLLEDRARHETAEAELQAKLQAVQQLRADMENERQAHDQETRLYQERRGVIDAAVAQIRHQQDELARQETDLKRRLADADAHAAQHQEQAALVEARTAQLSDLQQRLEADRQTLKERELALQRGEQARATLQEQLRRRSEELSARQRALTEQAQQQEAAAAQLQEQLAALAAQRAELEQRQQQTGQQTSERVRHLDDREAVLARQHELLEARTLKLQEMGRLLAAERKVLAEEKTRAEADRFAVEQAGERVRTDLGASKQELLDLQKQLPELEQRAGAAAERLGAARERLREHLAELHAYSREARDGLEAARTGLQTQAEDVRRRELTLYGARDEHRLAVAHFRQQLLDWQDQVGEMKRALAHGESRLERRQAEVEEQARAVDAGAAQLARQTEELSAQQQLVAERRTEMERHLVEMREWYRKKLRELSQVPSTPYSALSIQLAEQTPSEPAASSESAVGGAEEPVLPKRDILSMTDEASVGDRELGELLQSLELVEADTLTALLVEARRQKRSLRQLLLSGGYLTLYQLALIEAGNLDALVLGPTRVIDRLRVTSQEAVYRVFDPRRGKELLLRHLAEAEAEDAVRPDEFRQRFGATAAVRHPHLAATLEVLDIAGRPAVLQEWLTVLPSTDWPALVAVPGVWYRLVGQAALGLQTAHQAGLIHGHLDAGAVVVTADGTVKLRGLGEPSWLLERSEETGEGEGEAAAAAADLTSLGKVVAGWAALGPRSGKKAKPLPEPLLSILHRLTSTNTEKAYPNAAVLLEDLERAGSDLPPNAEAWDRLLRHVREALNVEAPARQSA